MKIVDYESLREKRDKQLHDKLERMGKVVHHFEEQLKAHRDRPEEFVEIALQRLSGTQREHCILLSACINDSAVTKKEFYSGELKGYLNCLCEFCILDWIEAKALYEWLMEEDRSDGEWDEE